MEGSEKQSVNPAPAYSAIVGTGIQLPLPSIPEPCFYPKTVVAQVAEWLHDEGLSCMFFERQAF